MNLLNRREFLENSTALTAAFAALSQMRPTPSIAEEKPPRSNPASETLRVAIVGVRGRGMSHVGGFNGRQNCEITTICDVDEASIGGAMKAVEAKNGKAPKFVQDIRKVLEDKTIDIISIATPNHWHALAAIWAIQAGKDVYVEKPVSHNVLEGRKIVEAARKHKRICQSGTQSRSMTGMRDAIAHLHTGGIGKVRLAYGACFKRRGSIGKVTGEQPVPKSVNYDLWCGPAPMTPLMRKNLHYDWHWTWNYGNGDLGNQGIHEMDKARWGLGQMTLPKSVISVGGRFGYIDDGETANTQICVFDYGEQELIFEVRGLESESPNPHFTGKKGGNFVGNIWFGANGVVVCPSYNSGVAVDKDGTVVKKFSGGNDTLHFDNFIAAVRSRKVESLNGDILEGHLSSALCHLGNISLRVGQEKALSEAGNFTSSKDAQAIFAKMLQHLKDNNVDVTKALGRVGELLPIDPQTERFTGNNVKASEMLSREYRKGFEVS